MMTVTDGVILEVEALFDQLVAWRRDFHQHPELGFEETRSARVIAAYLQELGLEVQTGIGQTGIVGTLEGGAPGSTLMLRFDMDALPIQEANDLPFASRVPGRMHACGHDGHMAIGLGAATLLARQQAELAGRVKFVFQPAEEGLGGAIAMIADGVLDDPHPDAALALHLWNHLPYGKVRVTPGPAMAASSTFTLTVQGKGGHGAAPHKANDPVLAAAHIVAALQSIVSRNIDPLNSVVVTIGEFSAGTTFNVIPETAVLRGTVRSYDNDTHRLIYRRILEMAKNMATAFGCEASMETVAIVPAVVNDAGVAEIVRQAAAGVVGADNVVAGRDMASEDMGHFLEEVPGCYFFIGSAGEAPELSFPHHHPRFNFDERALLVGLATMVAAAQNWLQKGP
jgi:amidohydrolase